MNKFLYAFLMVIVCSIPMGVSAQSASGVMQMVLFDYDGDTAELVKNFKARQSIYAKINPKASLRLLYDELHGAAVGRYRIHIDYPSLVYFAEAQVRERASKEWRSLAMGGATTRVYEGLSRVVLNPASAPSAGDGRPGVVQVILIDSNDGAALEEAVKKAQAVYAKINPEASMRLMYDELHGAAIGRYRLHIYFPSLDYFAAAQSREMASEEWRALRQRDPESSMTVYEGLSRVVVSSRQ